MNICACVCWLFDDFFFLYVVYVLNAFLESERVPRAPPEMGIYTTSISFGAYITICLHVIGSVNSELTPPYFNLAEGRKIHATSTCGVGSDGPELYCKLVGANTENDNHLFELIQGQVG